MLKVNTTLINAQGQNNAYKTLKGKKYISTPLALVRCKTKQQCRK